MIPKSVLSLICACFLLIAPVFAQAMPGKLMPEEAITEVRSKLEKDLVAEVQKSAEAWNKGDIRGFMDSYWNDEALRFASGNSVERGWQATLKRYLRTYGDDRESMGHLRFTDLEVSVLAEDAALVFGRFHLKRKAGDSTGLFTLTMKKFGERWQIVQDHTSAGD